MKQYIKDGDKDEGKGTKNILKVISNSSCLRERTFCHADKSDWEIFLRHLQIEVVIFVNHENTLR